MPGHPGHPGAKETDRICFGKDRTGETSAAVFFAIDSYAPLSYLSLMPMQKPSCALLFPTMMGHSFLAPSSRTRGVSRKKRYGLLFLKIECDAKLSSKKPRGEPLRDWRSDLERWREERLSLAHGIDADGGQPQIWMMHILQSCSAEPWHSAFRKEMHKNKRHGIFINDAIDLWLQPEFEEKYQPGGERRVNLLEDSSAHADSGEHASSKRPALPRAQCRIWCACCVCRPQTPAYRRRSILAPCVQRPRLQGYARAASLRRCPRRRPRSRPTSAAAEIPTDLGEVGRSNVPAPLAHTS